MAAVFANRRAIRTLYGAFRRLSRPPGSSFKYSLAPEETCGPSKSYRTSRKPLGMPREVHLRSLFGKQTPGQIFGGITNRRLLHTSVVSSSRVLVDDTTINYEVFGKSPKVALCLPGALGTIQSDFGPQIETLPQKDLQLVCWDPPGYGQSRPPNRKFDLDFLRNDANMAAKMMETLGYESYSLLGWSDGGITAMMLSSSHPERVHKMVVWGANAFLTHEDVALYQGIRDVSRWSAKMRAPMEAVYGPEVFRTTWEGWVDAFVALHRERDGDVCLDDLARVTCPTLILHGAKDPIVPLEHAKHLNNNIKESKLIIMDEGKHNIHLRFPQQFNKMVIEFLQD